jgi:TrmH family RNA methyltransferase
MCPPLPLPITSASNSTVKHVRGVAAGKLDGAVLLEGERLVRDAIRSGLNLDLLLVSDAREPLADEFEAAGLGPLLIEDSLLARIGKLKNGDGVLAIGLAPEMEDVATSLPKIFEAQPDALVFVAAGIAEPGNLGALARSAEAAGAAAMIHVKGNVSPWNPRALRGAMGSLFRLPVLGASSAPEAAAALAASGVRVVRGATRGGAAPSAFDWSGPVALWIGGETGDMSEIEQQFEAVTIPMAGAAESLNVTVASSLLLFAAGRAEPSGE